MQIDWNAAPIVDNRHGVITMDDDVDAIAVTGQRLIHRIIHHFPYKVV
jgi:hypothetical protein